jgi:hypothetical protein
MMDFVTASRQAGKLKGYIAENDMNKLITALSKAESFDSLPRLYRSWLENRENVTEEYLSETARTMRSQE